MNKTLNESELRKLYGESYISKYHKKDKIRIKQLFNFINIKKNDIVADIGCGNGLLLDYLYNKVKFYYGVDFSSGFIKIAKNKQKEKKIKNAKFVCKKADIFCKEFTEKFDKVFALDFSEHIYDNDFIKIFFLVYKSLKNDGKLYIHTPNGNYFLEIIKNKNLILKQFPEHVAIRTAKEYKYLLERVGFKNIRIAYLPHYLRILYIFNFLKYLPLIGDYFKARLLIKCEK